jgi:hypothetical protein
MSWHQICPHDGRRGRRHSALGRRCCEGRGEGVGGGVHEGKRVVASTIVTGFGVEATNHTRDADPNLGMGRKRFDDPFYDRSCTHISSA